MKYAKAFLSRIKNLRIRFFFIYYGNVEFKGLSSGAIDGDASLETYAGEVREDSSEFFPSPLMGEKIEVVHVYLLMGP